MKNTVVTFIDFGEKSTQSLVTEEWPVIEEQNYFLKIDGKGYQLIYPKHLIICIDQWDDEVMEDETIEDEIEHSGRKRR